MPSTLKRRGSPSLEEDAESSKRRFAESEEAPQSDRSGEEQPTAEDANDEGENAPAVGKVAPDASAADDAAVKPEPEADSMPAIAAGSTGGADSGYSPNQQEMKQDPGMEGVEGGEPDTWANTPPEERAIGMKEDG